MPTRFVQDDDFYSGNGGNLPVAFVVTGPTGARQHPPHTYMHIDGNRGRVMLHVGEIEDMINAMYESGTFGLTTQLSLLQSLYQFEQHGTIAETMYLLPRTFQNNYWRTIQESGHSVMFHVWVEAVYSEYHWLMEPTDLMDQMDLEDEVEMSHIIARLINHEVDFNFAAPAA